MQVLMLYGSPHQHGCTYTALSEVANALAEHNINSTIIQIRQGSLLPCLACGKCRQTGRCVTEDQVNEVAALLDDYDALIIGSPVHYASASGATSLFCDRLFFSASSKLKYKPGAAVVSARRAGTTAALDQLNKYFGITNMPIVSAGYWNMVHGTCAKEVTQDTEGIQTMRTLGHNMAWLLKCIKAGEESGIFSPVPEQKIFTNYIR